jgi:hypothetical protein
MAFKKTQTILSSFLQSIIDSYTVLNGKPEIFKDNEVIEQFHESIELGASKAFRFIINYNCKIGIISQKDLEMILVKEEVKTAEVRRMSISVRKGLIDKLVNIDHT